MIMLILYMERQSFYCKEPMVSFMGLKPVIPRLLTGRAWYIGVDGSVINGGTAHGRSGGIWLKPRRLIEESLTAIHG